MVRDWPNPDTVDWMVGSDSDTQYSCPLFRKIVSNGDKLERVGKDTLPLHFAKSSNTTPCISTYDVRMEECPHQLQCHGSRDHLHDDHLLSQLFITQTSVAVMTSPQQVGTLSRLDRTGTRTSRCSIKYEPDHGPPGCPPLCHKSNTERVVVALLFGALIIIFLTLVLSLIYLRETQQQQEYSHSLVHYNSDNRPLTTEERLIQWGAANNVKIKASIVFIGDISNKTNVITQL